MANLPIRHPVHKALHPPLTYFDSVGFPITRGMFWTAAGVALAVYIVLNTIIGAGIVLLVLGGFGIWSTHKDPRMWAMLKTAATLRTRYDAAKYEGT
jgi:hypothetical protein